MHKQGGLEKYLDRLARLYVSEGHRVTVLTSTSFDVQPSTPYTVVSLLKPLSCSWLHMIIFDFQVRRYLARNKGDVIFGFDRHFLPLTHYRAGNGCHRAYLAVRSKGMNIFQKILLWANPLHWITLLSERKTLLNPNTKIICNSYMVQKEFCFYYPSIKRENLTVIHNGVEWNEFEKPFQERLFARNSYCQERQIDPLIPHILFIGNEWKRKGVEPLLKGLALVKEPFFCTIVGKEKNFRFFYYLAQSLGLEKKIDFIPQHEKALVWYQRTDIAAILSSYDPFANVTTEALAMGLFVVSSSSNGGSEVLNQGTNGLVLDTLDPSSVKNAFEEAISYLTSRPNYKELIRNSAHAFDFKITLQTYRDIIT